MNASLPKPPHSFPSSAELTRSAPRVLPTSPPNVGAPPLISQRGFLCVSARLLRTFAVIRRFLLRCHVGSTVRLSDSPCQFGHRAALLIRDDQYPLAVLKPPLRCVFHHISHETCALMTGRPWVRELNSLVISGRLMLQIKEKSRHQRRTFLKTNGFARAVHGLRNISPPSTSRAM